MKRIPVSQIENVKNETFFLCLEFIFFGGLESIFFKH
jgi:hypothetical protein